MGSKVWAMLIALNVVRKPFPHLEARLKHSEALSHEDIQTQIVSTFADLQVEEVTRREAIERGLAEKELQVTHLREQSDLR